MANENLGLVKKGLEKYTGKISVNFNIREVQKDSPSRNSTHITENTIDEVEGNSFPLEPLLVLLFGPGFSEQKEQRRKR